MMKTRRSFTTILAAAGVLALVACSSTKKPSEDPQRSRSADLGSASAPNSCGSYMGDASFPLGATNKPSGFGGTITSADSPAQDGWFGPPGTGPGEFNEHSCDTPNPTPTVRDRGRDIHYDEIFLKNWTDADACISVWGYFLQHLDAAEGWEVAGYVGAFDPNDILKNNVGFAGGYVVHFAFKVPANTAFEVVVMAEAPYASDGTKYNDVRVDWGLNIANCGEPGAGGMSSSGGTSDGGASSSSSGGTSSSSSSSSGSSGDDAGSGTGKTW